MTDALWWGVAAIWGIFLMEVLRFVRLVTLGGKFSEMLDQLASDVAHPERENPVEKP